jgi:oligopeptide/dipeptide ABC transporter ATP-binding protein
MYAGQVVEEGNIDDIFHRPAHPYTRALLRSIPKRGKRVPGEKFKTIEGMVPNIKKLPSGCRFQGRCDIEDKSCLLKPIEMVALGEGRRSRCLFTDKLQEGAEETKADETKADETKADETKADEANEESK